MGLGMTPTAGKEQNLTTFLLLLMRWSNSTREFKLSLHYFLETPILSKLLNDMTFRLLGHILIESDLFVSTNRDELSGTSAAKT